jgi:hypothetical protein
MYADPKYRELPLEAVTLLNEGRYVEAVKAVRLADRSGLREAKARVDAYVDREPILKAQLELRQRSARRKFFFWFLVVDAAIVAAIVYWLRSQGSF